MSDNRTPDPIPGEGDPVAPGPKGGGEWPSKDTAPVEPAPGVVPERAEAIERERSERTARDGDLADAYDRDPDLAGSGSAPREQPDVN